jgi:hypothetical protein
VSRQSNGGRESEPSLAAVRGRVESSEAWYQAALSSILLARRGHGHVEERTGVAQWLQVQCVAGEKKIGDS